MNPHAGAAAPLFMVGHLTVDDIVLPDGTTRMQQIGGAPVFAATGARLAGGRPCVVTALAPSLPTRVREWLAEEEIALLDCGRASRHITQWVLYETTGERTFLHHPASADLYEAAPLAECWHPAGPPAWAHIAPMPVSLQAAWVRALTGAGLSVTLDPHEDCSAEHGDAVLELLPRLTAFMPSEQEAASLFGRADMTAAAAAFVAAGARLCVIKLGAAGCVVATAAGSWRLPSVATSVVDTTGAGDSFCGAFVAALASGHAPETAARYGTAAASYTVQCFGVPSLRGGSPADWSLRLNRIRTAA
ncbi:MAG TPA: carbohydrate kinase family protein [Amycolatopsis sp.]|nr:carbohydrate kinase family protein [Amycolatopsis sp.]